MRFLLDTHTVLWAARDPQKLGPDAEAIIRNSDNERLFSAATIWELAIKINIGKIDVPGGLTHFLSRARNELMLTQLDIIPEHALILETLPLHHRDPFDRLLVAQCMFENVPIVSVDDKLDLYSVRRIW